MIQETLEIVYIFKDVKETNLLKVQDSQINSKEIHHKLKKLKLYLQREIKQNNYRLKRITNQ